MSSLYVYNKKQTKPLHAIIVPSILNKQFFNQLQPAVEPSIHEILDELPKIIRFVDYHIQLGLKFFFIGVALDKSSPIFITLQKSLEFYIQNGFITLLNTNYHGVDGTTGFSGSDYALLYPSSPLYQHHHNLP